MPSKKPWIHPAHDELCDKSRFIHRDPEDPRTVGDGPCHQIHLDRRSALDPTAHAGELYGGNAHCRWVRCARCGLVTGYWPKIADPGSHRQNLPPLPSLEHLLGVSGLVAQLHYSLA